MKLVRGDGVVVLLNVLLTVVAVLVVFSPLRAGGGTLMKLVTGDGVVVVKIKLTEDDISGGEVR